MPEINISIKNCTADSSQCNKARKEINYIGQKEIKLIMQRLLFKFKTQSNLQVSD